MVKPMLAVMAVRGYCRKGGDAGRSGCDAGRSGDKVEVLVASVTGVAGLGGSDVRVDGRGGEGGSDGASKASEKLGGSEDDLLSGEMRGGGRGE